MTRPAICVHQDAGEAGRSLRFCHIYDVAGHYPDSTLLLHASLLYADNPRTQPSTFGVLYERLVSMNMRAISIGHRQTLMI